MPLQASWIHGNALTVEQPGVLASPSNHYGWGADVEVTPGQSSWFHIPVPTPVIVSDVRTKFQKFFILFETVDNLGSISQVHIYDGSFKIQEFNNLNHQGAHRTQLDGYNTFNLSTPHTVLFGIGITFLFQASTAFDGPNPPARLIVGSAGVDFFT